MNYRFISQRWSISGKSRSPHRQSPVARPPYTYCNLIAMAIHSSEEKQLPLKAIYNYISCNFPYYANDSKGWKNSIRHNLSLNPGFIKISLNDRRGNKWAIHPDHKNMLEHGYSKRRKKSRTATQQQPPSKRMKTSPPEAAKFASDAAAMVINRPGVNCCTVPGSNGDQWQWQCPSNVATKYIQESGHQYFPFVFHGHGGPPGAYQVDQGPQGTPSPNVLSGYQFNFYDGCPCTPAPASLPHQSIHYERSE